MSIEQEFLNVIGERDLDRPLTSLETVLAKSVLVGRNLPVPAGDTTMPQTIREWLQWCAAASQAR